MLRYCLIIFFIINSAHSFAQTFVISGSVSGEGRRQEDALIDIYEYNSSIKTIRTDKKGLFSISLIKGDEYILVFYKQGFVLQSISITASESKRDTISGYSVFINLDKDGKLPEGLYFKQPMKRIVTDSTGKTNTDAHFFIGKIRPQQRADTIMVLFNRAQANQYILVSNMRLGSKSIDTNYSQEVEVGIRKEIADNREKMKRSIARYDSISALEEKHKKAAMTVTGSGQLAQVIEAQRLLADRLSESAEHCLLEQQQFLAFARLNELTALRNERNLATATDSGQIRMFNSAADNARLSAINNRYRAMDANRKFQLNNKYQSLNYQEYIEMWLYQKYKEDTAYATAHRNNKVISAPVATAASIDTSDNLSRMNDKQRTTLIGKALDEEKRFKNYNEKTEVKKVDGTNMSVKNIRIADDNYEEQTDKNGKVRYLKNGKPITKTTFEFETKRKMDDVLNTIKEVDKYGK